MVRMTSFDRVRGAARFAVFIIYTFGYLIESYVGRLFIRGQIARRRFHSKTVSRYTRGACRMMGVTVDVKGLPAPGQNFLLVGNHLGFMDILALSSVKSCLFITSVEMRETPFLGTLCEMGGCIFVERRSRTKIVGELTEIREALTQGFDVVLYPEGTSGDGEKVLPFKKSLMISAAGTGIPLKVMVINYRRINGEPMSDKWRNFVCWYGDMTFLPAIWGLFCLKTLEVEISFHEEIHVESEDDRHQVTAKAQHLVETHFDAIRRTQ